MKKIFSLFIVITLLSLIPIHADVIPAERQLPRLVDRANILDDAEEAHLLGKLDDISEEIGCDVAVVTVNSLEGKSAQAYADDFYDYNGYGMGSGDDGILLLLSMNEREWAVTTYGFIIRAIPSGSIDSIVDEILPDLSAGFYHDAFENFAEICKEHVNYYYENGMAIGEYYEELTLGEKIASSAVIGAIVSLIIMLVMKGGMKTVKRNNYASPYIVDGSLNITDGREFFLYRNITRTRRESQSSGTHRSSSGRSHGGSSGRF